MPLPLLALSKFIPLKGWLALGLVGALGGGVWYHTHEIGQRDDIIAAKDARITGLKEAIVLEATQKALAYTSESLAWSKVQRQSESITGLQLARQAAESMANIEAIRAFSQGLKMADTERHASQVPPGFVGMNSYIAEAAARLGQ